MRTRTAYETKQQQQPQNIGIYSASGFGQQLFPVNQFTILSPFGAELVHRHYFAVGDAVYDYIIHIMCIVFREKNMHFSAFNLRLHREILHQTFHENEQELREKKKEGRKEKKSK